MRRPAVAIVLAVVVAAGCAANGRPGLPDIPSLTCGDVPSAACEEQANRVVTGLTGIESVVVECDVDAACTRAGGHGLAEIRFSNGQKVSRPWSFVGDVGPPPVVTCVGLAAGLCNAAMVSEIGAVSPSTHVVSVTVTCTAVPCTDAEGKTIVHIVLEDGSATDYPDSWTSE